MPAAARMALEVVPNRGRIQLDTAQGILHVCTWQPTRPLDYNDAGLLYFARYHRRVERAEVPVLRKTSARCCAVADREMCARPRTAEIRRARDGRRMARVITLKRRITGDGK
jgi:hypothetical protein